MADFRAALLYAPTGTMPDFQAVIDAAGMTPDFQAVIDAGVQTDFQGLGAMPDGFTELARKVQTRLVSPSRVVYNEINESLFKIDVYAGVTIAVKNCSSGNATAELRGVSLLPPGMLNLDPVITRPGMLQVLARNKKVPVTMLVGRLVVVGFRDGPEWVSFRLNYWNMFNLLHAIVHYHQPAVGCE